MTEELRTKIGDRAVIASVSGGKDSAALCLHLRELGVPYEAIFMDTGWEHPATYSYLRDELPRTIGPIRWLRWDVALDETLEPAAQELEAMLGHYSAMVRLALLKGVFPSRRMRWCTEYLKLRTAFTYFDTLVDVVNAVGVRGEESPDRASILTDGRFWEPMEPPAGMSPGIDVEQWRPLLAWTFDEVVAIHRRHSLRPNPLYMGTASRVGCYPCIFATKVELRHIDPARVDVMRRLEALVGERAKARRERDGKAPMGPPAFFQAKSNRAYRDETSLVCDQCGRPWRNGQGHKRHESPAAPIAKARRVQDGANWPIDKAIAWAKTARGGRQFELFTAEPHERGCVRWGMCDTRRETEG
jgi:3'-phosphoadenosine 5'-phosphosulfate sulfotransferase (PAPS reductase)/FAD synthetase